MSGWSSGLATALGDAAISPQVSLDIPRFGGLIEKRSGRGCKGLCDPDHRPRSASLGGVRVLAFQKRTDPVLFGAGGELSAWIFGLITKVSAAFKRFSFAAVLNDFGVEKSIGIS